MTSLDGQHANVCLPPVPVLHGAAKRAESELAADTVRTHTRAVLAETQSNLAATPATTALAGGLASCETPLAMLEGDSVEVTPASFLLALPAEDGR